MRAPHRFRNGVHGRAHCWRSALRFRVLGLGIDCLRVSLADAPEDRPSLERAVIHRVHEVGPRRIAAPGVATNIDHEVGTRLNLLGVVVQQSVDLRLARDDEAGHADEERV